MRQRIAQDVSELDTNGFGPRSPMWWGTLAFCTLEATGFALAVGSYLYLAWLNPEWPLSVPPPDWIWGGLLTGLILLSLYPNMRADRHGREQNLRAVQIDLLIMSAVGLILIALRFLEFGVLHVRWDVNAYGSILWTILGLHTVHLITDVADTLVLTALMFTRHATPRRFSDVSDNAFYWNFVVASWVPIFLLLYGGPRL